MKIKIKKTVSYSTVSGIGATQFIKSLNLDPIPEKYHDTDSDVFYGEWDQSDIDAALNVSTDIYSIDFDEGFVETLDQQKDVTNYLTWLVANDEQHNNINRDSYLELLETISSSTFDALEKIFNVTKEV